jgi:hypothetical protein
VRRFAFRVDQLPVWAFVLGAISAFAVVRAGRLFALVHQSHGGMELGGIATLAVFLAVVIFAVRRRQVSAWHSTVQVLGSLVIGNACALLMVWPFVPEGYGVALTPLLRDTMVAGLTMMLLALPIGIGLLWLSRRYGSNSQLTERRRMAQR